MPLLPSYGKENTQREDRDDIAKGSTFADDRYFLDLKGAQKCDFVESICRSMWADVQALSAGASRWRESISGDSGDRPSNSEEEEETAAVVIELELILLLTDLLAIAFAS
jgi:hypothetical protein